MKTQTPFKLIETHMHHRAKHAIAFLLLILLLTAKAIAQPSITSFSPASGQVGSMVTITGSGFNTNPAANIVYFGTARAEVISATGTMLTVKVPAGATFEPITVTSNTLTAYSARPFITTFTGGGSINQESFRVSAAADSVPNSIFETADLEFADFDGDGKTDAAVIDGINNKLSIYKNTTTNKITSFSARQDFETALRSGQMSAGDLDGDGRPDLVVISNSDSYSISVYKNISTPGSISFAARIDLPMRTPGTDLKVRDLDGDGRQDVAVIGIDLDSTNGLRSLVSILRNIGSPGTIKFEAQTDISIGFFTKSIGIGNLDDDSKPEIVLTAFVSHRLLIVKNNSTPGLLSFGPGPILVTGNTPGSVSIGDLDLDGKQDLVSANFEGSTVSIFRNISTGGTLAFSSKLDHAAGTKPLDVEISDLDGDGKPDLAVSDLQNAMVIIRNQSTIGSFSFSFRTTYATNFADDFSIADVNNDGQPDLGVISGFYRLLFWDNRIGFPLISYFSPYEAARGDTIRINGTHFTNATSVTIGGQAALSYQVISPTSITAVVGSAVSGDVVVTTPRGSHSKSGFIFKAPPIITGFTPKEGGRGKSITITGHNFTGTSAVKFGGVHATGFEVVSPDKLVAYVNYGASGAIEVTNRFGTASIDGFIFLPVPVIHSFSPAKAASGTTVTIKGKFLTMTEEVKFDMYPAASFAVINDSTVTAVVGRGGSGSITVSTRGGSATIAGFIMLPGITSFSPIAAATGDTITIRGTNLWTVSRVDFGAGWTFTLIRISDTIMKAIVPENATSGNVTVISSHGSTALPGFTFIPRPVITAMSPLIGGKGTIVTITGMNYENVYSVTFGGAPAAKFTVVSSTSILAEIGDSATGFVSVKSRGGTSTYTGPSPYIYHYFLYTTVPVINHFSPSAAAVGSEVTITGANFDPVAGNNIVYFGPVRSTVTHATMNTLKVLVPSGASYERISVTRKNLTGYSGKPFVVTFKGDTTLTAATFGNFINFPTGKSPAYITSGDLDNDGKTDLIVANRGSNTISILRNIGTNGEIRFAPKMDIVVGEGPYLLRAADIDGDAKPEILSFTYGSGGYKAQILPNTTINGTISFGDAVEWDAGWHPKELAIGDVDNDGKSDIMIVNTNTRFSNGVYLRVFPNGSTPGNIVMKAYSHYLGLSRPYSGSDDRFLNSIAVGDLNDDGRLDIAVGYSREYYDNEFTIYSEGQWDNLVHIKGTDYSPQRNVLMGDFDVDGKLDIIDEKNVFRYKNNFTFGYDKVNVVGENSLITDVNGDGKADVVTLKPFAVSVFKNTSIPGAASFNQKMDFATGAFTSSMIAGDFNGDGRPEIVVANLNDNTVSILKNQSGTGIVKVCAGAGGELTSNINGSNYQWQVNDGNGFVNISDNSNYTGAATNRLRLINIPASLNGMVFRCLVDGTESNLFSLEVVSPRSPSVSLTSSADSVCSETRVTFTAVSANIGTDPVFQWYVNDVLDLGAYNNNVYTAYLKNNNDKVKVRLTSNDHCITNTVVTSNVITTAVTMSVTPSATISSSATNIICEGMPVTFTAAITNGGNAPLYQWQVNGVNTGSTGSSFYTNALTNFDQVKLVLTSNAVCATKSVVNSNIITVTVVPKPVSKALAPANLCFNNDYKVTYNSVNTRTGSIIELWQRLNGNAFTRAGSMTYNGTALEFQFNSGSSNAIYKYFFTVLPPSTVTCAASTNSDTVTVEISTLGKPVIGINVDSLTVMNVDAGASYFWQQLNGGLWTDLSVGGSKKSMKMYSTGTFRVRAELGGCTEVSEALAIVVTGLPDLQANARGIKLHPNPTISLLTLDSLALSDKWETLDIMSADGIKKFATFNIRNRTSLTIHLDKLPQGLYVAVFRRRNQKPVSIKFVKM